MNSLAAAVQVRFRNVKGVETQVSAEAGWSIMKVAQNAGIPGILAECGGLCSCATCHIYIDDAFLSVLPAIGSMEEEMLEGVATPREDRSRLSCQVELTSAMSGIVVHIPETQM